ncbi:MAG: NUDIX hydrolase [Lactobacillaceae bacterium]|nr:NUDIX hydrolase [Lactobacillaceae bacterium]
MKKGEIITEEPRFQGKIFDVVTRKIKTPDDITVIRDVVLHGDAVAMIMPVIEDGETKYVIGTEYRAGTNSMRSSFPAGLINKGENPTAAALREAREEMGLDYGKADLIQVISTSEGFTNEQTYLMMLSDLKGDVQTHFDADELVHKELVTLDELLEKIATGQIQTAPAIIGSLYLQLIEED